MPQCWQIISLSQERSERGITRGEDTSSNLMTRYESGEGSRGKGLRVNIMHAWLPPSTQHQHGTTRTGLTQRISSGSPPPQTPFGTGRGWIGNLYSRYCIWILVVFGFAGFGYRLSIVDCRLSSPRLELWCQVYCLPRLRLHVMPFCVECFGHK